MATVATDNSGPARGNPHLLQIPPRLPFPTTPSMPDRRARLKRLNLNMASRESVESESSQDFERSKRRTRGQRGMLDSSYSGDSSFRDVSMAGDDEVYNSTQLVRRKRRNIVTARRYQSGEETSMSLASRRRRVRSHMETGRVTERLRLPSIGARQSMSSPQGIFLTALTGYDETPLTTERQPSDISRSSRGVVNHVTGSGSCNGRDKSPARDRLPVLVPSSRSPPPAATATTLSTSPEAAASTISTINTTATTTTTTTTTSTEATVRNTVGLQRVYLEGLDYMRGHVTNVEDQVHRLNREFHRVQTESGDDFFLYLKECDERLLQANNDLRKRDIKLEVLDSDARLVRLLNELRSGKHQDKPLIEFLTTFWDQLKHTTQALQALVDKFNHSVLVRLSNNYIGSHSADLQVPVCQQYALDIEGFLKDLDTQIGNAKLMITSFGNGMHKDLLDTSDFAEHLMVTCDLKAFPLLGFVHDVCGKILRMCSTARMWLARDETFMHEINSFIRETRTAAKRRERVLLTEKQKRKKQEKSVRIAQSILHNNREKLRLIEGELQQLESRMDEFKGQQKVKVEEIHQKESMVDFLKITLQQTKRNYTLQSKRTKLLRQVKELEDYLRGMETDLEVVQDRILAKSHEKILLTEKVNHSEKSYGALKNDLDRFSENLEELEAEVTGLSGQLLQLEIVHTMKTSPETLDNLEDRPSTVKLSKSLKEKIRERKKKAAAKLG